MDRIKWIFYKYFLYSYRYIYKRIFKRNINPKTFAGKKILTQHEGNDYIIKLLKSDKPCMIGRYGSNELRVLADSIATEINLFNGIRDNSLSLLTNGAGFFPSDKNQALEFGKIMQESSQQLDLLGIWFNAMEDYVIKNFAPKTQLTYLRGLEPWYSDNPWTSILHGKRVLVIHPFEETITKQYINREMLFDNPNVLPEFTLLTLKAVQTVAGQKDERFQTWFEALDYMFEEAMKKDFDIAILGCGAYGFPLAAKIKSAGKKAIHLGGATQLLFGIEGKRWDNHPFISSMYNKHWVRPTSTERPSNADIVEGACYW